MQRMTDEVFKNDREGDKELDFQVCIHLCENMRMYTCFCVCVCVQWVIKTSILKWSCTYICLDFQVCMHLCEVRMRLYDVYMLLCMRVCWVGDKDLDFQICMYVYVAGFSIVYALMWCIHASVYVCMTSSLTELDFQVCTYTQTHIHIVQDFLAIVNVMHQRTWEKESTSTGIHTHIHIHLVQDFLAIVNAGMHQQTSEKDKTTGVRKKK
jgi:hypothetical protein